MRVRRAMILAGATILLGIAPSTAQRYDPNYPVCLQKWQRGGSNALPYLLDSGHRTRSFGQPRTFAACCANYSCFGRRAPQAAMRYSSASLNCSMRATCSFSSGVCRAAYVSGWLICFIDPKRRPAGGPSRQRVSDGLRRTARPSASPKSQAKEEKNRTRAC
jgi:hypothetical protein